MQRKCLYCHCRVHYRTSAPSFIASHIHTLMTFVLTRVGSELLAGEAAAAEEEEEEESGAAASL